MEDENKMETIKTCPSTCKGQVCDIISATKTNNPSYNFVNIDKKISSVKKQLYFSTGKENLDSTLVEENKMCTYKPNEKNRKSKKLSVNFEEDYRKREENFLNSLEKEIKLNEKIKSPTEEKVNISTNKNNFKFDSPITKKIPESINSISKNKNGDIVYNLKINQLNLTKAENNIINVSVAVKQSDIRNLSVSEKYDIQNNFFPKPGCSKMVEEAEKNTDSINFNEIVNDPAFIKQQIQEFNTYKHSKLMNALKTHVVQKEQQLKTINDKTFDNKFSINNFSAGFNIAFDNVDFSSAIKNTETLNKQIEEYKNYNFNSRQTIKKNNSNDHVEKETEQEKEMEQNNFCKMSVEENCITSEENKIDAPKSIIITPKINPPSATDVESSLSEYNIPEASTEKPFYSNFNDVTTKMDIGHNVLKIPGKTVADVEEFDTCTGFTGIENWRKNMFTGSELSKSNLRKTLAGFSECVITPSTLPPSKQEVIKWLKSKVKNDNVIGKKVDVVEKPRIHIPLSPGNESLDETLTLSPCSPLDKSYSENTSTDTKMPSLHLSSREYKNKKGNLQKRALFTQTILSQKSIEDSQKKFSPEELELSQKIKDILGPERNLEGTQKCINDIEEIPHDIKNSSSKSEKLGSSFDHLRLKPSDLNLTEPSPKNLNDSCQITGVTLDNTHGFQMSYENLQNAKALAVNLNLTVLVVEIHTQARGDLNPDPDYDSVRAIFYTILHDVNNSKMEQTGIIAVDTLPGSPNPKGLPRPPILDGFGTNCEIFYTKSEFELFNEFVSLVHKYDPDIFAGYEIEMFSWGYLIDRAYTLGLNLPILVSRLNPENANQKNEQDESELKIPGRIILDVWRLMRHEIALQSYTFESIMYHILHRRVPLHSFKDLSFWWEHKTNLYRHITADYYITRVEGILKILDQLDLIGRTSELAKLFGIQFYEVLSRGSQFRVESLMLRLAKPQNYIAVSPSVAQRAKMRAPEFLPLILEPESRLYTDPVIVLDFQSLYPSIIIAYNYCFSTCLGRVEKLGTTQPFEFGATQLKIPPAKLQKLHNKINFSPCGVGFVRPEIRRGILPRMLQEILETRLMVKQSMKENKDNKILQRVLHSRQLGLKLIANVTYGYTAANFSGRMPCIEVGDSVVSKGRETLERAIKLIENNEEWRVRVVYGDTDSLFVLVPGRNKKEAFRIGAEIAEAVTNDNPSPVKLKLEKILQPCILQTKKRYVGYMYETEEQENPEYLAKGIETVRRDGCPAVAKMLEKCLRMLFETCDVSLIKKYIIRQFTKILSGKASIQDLIFAKEYRGADGYRPGACVPALELAK